MTYQNPEPSDSATGRLNEIEVTPAMIEAGVTTFNLFERGERTSLVVEAIYEAMEAARVKAETSQPALSP